MKQTDQKNYFSFDKYIYTILIVFFSFSFTNNAYGKDFGEDLFKAVASNNLSLVKKLVENKGADVNYVRTINSAFFIPVLMQAVMDNRTEIAIYLIEKGADINSKDGFLMTSLMWAAYNGNVELVKLLISKGADKLAVDQSGNSATKAAQEKGHLDIVELLK